VVAEVDPVVPISEGQGHAPLAGVAIDAHFLLGVGLGGVAGEARDIGDAQAQGRGSRLLQAAAIGLAELPAGKAPLGALGREVELGGWGRRPCKTSVQVGSVRLVSSLAIGPRAGVRGISVAVLAKEGSEPSFEDPRALRAVSPSDWLMGRA
jgi:hypothetical protein